MSLKTFLAILGVVAVVSLAASAVVFAFAYRRLKKIRIPKGSDFWTTLRAVPLGLVVALDLLDLGLESFSAPLEWLILNRLGLQSLRNVATFEALIPFTGPIPTLTISWIAARVFKLGKEIDPNVIEAEEVAPGRYEVKLPK